MSYKQFKTMLADAWDERDILKQKNAKLKQELSEAKAKLANYEKKIRELVEQKDITAFNEFQIRKRTIKEKFPDLFKDEKEAGNEK